MALPRAAGDVAGRRARGAAWRSTWRPAEAVRKTAEALARCVEVARWCRKAKLGRPTTPEGKTEAVAARRLGEREMGAHK